MLRQVESLTSNKQGRQSVIVDRIGYDKEGHMVYTKLGNGAETTYTYDKQRERLQAMNLTADGQTVMENRYRYDAVDNILGITNAANPTSLTRLNKAKLGGRSSHTYEYDELNRLIHASGKAKRVSYDMVIWIQTPHPNTTPNTSPGPPVSWNDPSNPDDPQAGYGYIPNDTTKEETFFYHSDHLGSTSYITDDKANITQYDAYLPYGELLVDEHSSSEDMPYKFNGKEMDAETGLYYYGARYMNPVTSLWYGVDPLAEKYVATGGYVYTLDNPVRLIDPDGRKLEGATKSDAAKMLEDINVVFKAEKFAEFRKLISRSGKHATGKDFNKIDPAAYSNYIANNSELSNDDKALMDILVNSINSDDFTYKFQYVSENDELQDKSMLAPQLVEAIESTGHTVLTKFLGGSQTKQTKKGSYSLVVEDDRSPRDYYNNLGEQVPNPLGRVLYVFHEVFGHGRSLSLGRGSDNQHGDAIRLENLVLRVAGFSNIQRNGEDHGPKSKIPNNSQLPDYR